MKGVYTHVCTGKIPREYPITNREYAVYVNKSLESVIYMNARKIWDDFPNEEMFAEMYTESYTHEYLHHLIGQMIRTVSPEENVISRMGY